MVKERDDIKVGDAVRFDTSGYGHMRGTGVVEFITDGDAQPWPFQVRVAKPRCREGHVIQLKRHEITKGV